jgi:hypothetical protein
MPTIVINCPKCLVVNQSVTVPDASLKNNLQSGQDIMVTGSVCGHTWKLAGKDLENLRAAAAGA